MTTENDPTPEQEPEQQHQEYNDPYEPIPRRHGCVTAWLVFMIVCNAIVGLIYASTATKLERILHTPVSIVLLLILISGANVIFAILLLQWKKIGFYGCVVGTLAAFVINIMVGVSPVQCVLGLAGLGILYAILQIPQDGVPAWKHLK